MTILCRNIKMFPLIISGVLQLQDGPLVSGLLSLQVEYNQNFGSLGFFILIEQQAKSQQSCVMASHF